MSLLSSVGAPGMVQDGLPSLHSCRCNNLSLAAWVASLWAHRSSKSRRYGEFQMGPSSVSKAISAQQWQVNPLVPGRSLWSIDLASWSTTRPSKAMALESGRDRRRMPNAVAPSLSFSPGSSHGHGHKSRSYPHYPKPLSTPLLSLSVDVGALCAMSKDASSPSRCDVV